MISRIRKRAYIATAFILAALVGLAYFTTEESKKLALEVSQTRAELPLQQKSKLEPEQPSQAPETTASESNTITPPAASLSQPKTTTKPATKSQTLFLDINQYSSSLSEIEVAKGTKVTLIVKAFRAIGANGFVLSLPNQEPVQVKATGETVEIHFSAESDFEIPVSEIREPDQTLYTIKVDVN